MSTSAVLGSWVKAQVTAAGMLMLALRDPDWLENWRQRGWAISEQQLELTYRGVAVPLIDRKGDLVGALTFTELVQIR